MRAARTAPWPSLALAAVLLASCDRLAACEGLAGAGAPAAGETSAPTRSSGTPAGASCTASRDCAEGQACVGETCRATRTTVQGELLAASAAQQLAAGEFVEANETYVAALRAFEQANVPVPPAVLCGSAEAALGSPREAVPREIAARRAFACFRGSLPGDPARVRVLEKVAEVRHEGLDLAAFDEAETPTEFFTAPRRRPDPGAVRVHVELAGQPGAGSAEIDARLQSAPVAQAVVACFLADWELHHQRRVEATLPIRVSSRLRDMGSYDIYEASVSIDAGGPEERGFGPCTARALESIFAESIRMARTVSWNASITVRASAR